MALYNWSYGVTTALYLCLYGNSFDAFHVYRLYGIIDKMITVYTCEKT